MSRPTSLSAGPSAEDPSTAFRLDSESASLVFDAASPVPKLLYWGERLEGDAAGLGAVLERPVLHGLLDDPEPLTCFPETGQGFQGSPGLEAHRDGESFFTQLERIGIQQDEDRLSVELEDRATKIQVRIDIESLGDLFRWRTSVHSTAAQGVPLTVDWLAAAAIALPPGLQEVQLFEGQWCRELHGDRLRLDSGSLLRENRTGRTSHQSFPAMVFGEAGFSAEHGAVYALHLAWSGNHRLIAERTRTGQLQAQLGELLLPGEVQLAGGEQLESPWVYLGLSQGGTNGLAEHFHAFVRGHLVPKTRRPVHFNTWEALYFDHSEEKTLELVAEARRRGAERFVLDDGWFRGREHDRAGLGDWEVCETKYPRGLEPIVDAVEAAGLEMGLWVEPEMVNADSDLCRRHPDWLLQSPGRQQPLGRHQHALDLTRDDVRHHLLETLVGLVDRYRLRYFKWDMNRDLCHVEAQGRPAQRAMTLAYYRLLDAFRTARPDVEVEACSSGGARVDYEVLRRVTRLWPSDSHDPKERQMIHRGYNLFFPPEVLGMHVGSERSETSGRTHAMAFRAHTALFGHLGIEPTRRPLSSEDAALLERTVAFYKEHRSWLHEATTLYLEHAETELVSRLALAADGSRALLAAALLDTPRQILLAPLRLRGLPKGQRWRVTLLEADQHSFAKSRSAMHRGEPVAATSEALHYGLQLPPLRPESLALFELVALAPEDS